jgi:hypothetical protein
LAGPHQLAQNAKKVFVTAASGQSSSLFGKMNHRNLDNNTFDRIGQRLVKVARVPDSEIDKLVANSELFSLVSKRIGRVTVDKPSHSALFLFIRQNALAFAGAAILLIVVVGVASLLRPEKAPTIVKDQRVPADKPDVVASPVFPPQEVNTGKHSAGDVDNGNEFSVENAVYVPRSRNNQRRAVVPVREEEGDFLPVTYTGDAADTAAGGRILRVELKRSSLFALGVNLPLENDYEEMVKADLLIGRDGVTRGIRIVN